MVAAFEIEELRIPESLDDSPEARDFVAATEVRNVVEKAGFGSPEYRYSPEELLPGWQNQEHEPKRMLVARVDGRVVARAGHEWRPTHETADTCWQEIKVLPEFRGRGIGTALADLMERFAREQGKSKILTWTVSPPGPGPRLDAPTGSGSLPADNVEVRFLLARGFRLEQVVRSSRLSLPVEPARLAEWRSTAEERAGSDYRVHHWVDRAPERWREELARLFTRMSTDAPSAGMEEPEDPWSVERLLDEEERRAASPRRLLTAAVEHVASGRLAGYTELAVPDDVARTVDQEDTLVVREHRGHRLGMLLKVANIAELERRFPGHPAIVTFNAEENRFMLDVNESVGFVPVAFEGAWRKDL